MPGVLTRRIICTLLFVIWLPCFSSQASADEDGTYPRNEVERPLTLPKGMGEVELMLADFEWTANNEIDHGVFNLGVLSFRVKYGLTDNLQINNLGLGYRIFRGQRSELLLYGAIDDVSVGLERSTEISASTGIASKLRMGNAFAVILEIYDHYRYQSSIADENTIGCSAGLMYSLTDSLSALLKAGYEERMLAADLDITETKAGLQVQHNIVPALDIVYALNVDRVHNKNSTASDYTEGQFTISVKWRW